MRDRNAISPEQWALMMPRLLELTDRFWSKKDIAVALSQEFQVRVTRNAVVGRIWRSKPHPPKRENIVTTKSRLLSRSKNVPWRPDDNVPPPPPPENLIAITDLEPHHCRWPIDVGGVVHYCGCAKVYGSYCRQHAEMAYGTSNSGRIKQSRSV